MGVCKHWVETERQINYCYFILLHLIIVFFVKYFQILAEKEQQIILHRCKNTAL